MKAIVGIAVVLGLAGTVLGLIELFDDGGKFEFDELTLELQGGQEERVEFDAPGADKDHPFDIPAFTANSEISGDRTGEYARTCVPVPIDDVECSGGFLLEDGDIEVEGTEEGAEEDTAAHTAIVGGTGAYEGAVGSMQVEWEQDSYVLHLLIPEQ